MSKETQRSAPSYDQVFYRTRTMHTQSHAFNGTKLDMTKEMFGKSAFTLSNTEHGLSLNYVINTLGNVFTMSMHSNGMILGKMTPELHGSGATVTYMQSANSVYMDVDVTKVYRNASVSVKIIDPEIERSTSVWSASSILSTIKEMNKKEIKERIQKHTEDVRRTVKQPVSELRSAFVNAVKEKSKVVKGGIFSVSGIVCITPTVHAGMEHLVSLSTIKDTYKKNVVSTYLVSKIFDSWRVMCMWRSTGKAGISVEKAVDESTVLYAEVFADVRSVQNKKLGALDSITGVIGASIIGDTISTKVSANTEGVIGAVSDVCIADGASLNLSTQLSANGSQIGIGFTVMS